MRTGELPQIVGNNIYFVLLLPLKHPTNWGSQNLIFKKKSEMMSMPNEWLDNEKKYDLENTKDGDEKLGVCHDTKKGTSLNNLWNLRLVI